MKRLLILSWLLISAWTLHAQSLSNLDAANGFKDFHFGDLKSKWKPFLSSTDKSQINYEDHLFRYMGPCCQTAFNRNVSLITLLFDSATNKLVSVMLIMEDMDESYIDLLRLSIKRSFGDPTSIDNTGPFNSLFWDGAKVSFDMMVGFVGNQKYRAMLTYSMVTNKRGDY